MPRDVLPPGTMIRKRGKHPIEEWDQPFLWDETRKDYSRRPAVEHAHVRPGDVAIVNRRPNTWEVIATVLRTGETVRIFPQGSWARVKEPEDEKKRA